LLKEQYSYHSKKFNVKVVLLAGGLGLRARPFSNYCPKAMIPVNGRPMIDYIVRFFSKFDFITEILIVCEFDQFGKQIINYFEGKESQIGKNIHFIEDTKKGTGGSLVKCREYLKDDPFFLLWYSDNLCMLKLDELVPLFVDLQKRFHESKVGSLIAKTARYEETGRLVIDSKIDMNFYSVKEFKENLCPC
jgi:mannose-1-phosphate guanylyltransferase